MFIGHFAVGFGAKSVKPSVSLGTLFLAAQFLDLLWPTLLLVGLERVEITPGITAVNPLDFTHYPITHSLLGACGWGILVGGVYWLIKRNSGAALVVGLCVVSHWLLDLIVHRPDLPMYPGDSPMVGLGLWNSAFGTMLVEGLIFVAGLAIYLRATRALDRAGSIGFWALIGFLLLIYAANLAGPPPENAAAIAWAGQAQWLLVLWAYWLDRHRVPRRPSEGLKV